MGILVIAEHDNVSLKAATLNAVTAAAKIGGEVHLLDASKGCGAVDDAEGQGIGGANELRGRAPADFFDWG